MLSLISIVNGAPVPAASTRSNARALAGWQAYMNQGIETGAAYANAGASGDDVLLQDLNAETADKFDGLNSGKTTAGSPAVIADGQLSDGILTAVNQLTSALGSPASSPSSAAAAVDEKASEPPHGASWQDYMMQGIQTGIEFASAGAGVASGTTDPSTDFGALSAQTADHFDALNHKGGAAAAPAKEAGGQRRKLTAGWQSYMNQGIATGVQYAGAGAGVAAGTTDPSTGFNGINAETADQFDALNRKGEAIEVAEAEAEASPDAATPAVGASDALSGGILAAANQFASALGSGASSATSASPAAASPASAGASASEPPHGASWQDYMMQGIQTGIEFASAGAGVASGTTDPSTDFGALSAQTADHFDALNHKGGAAAEDAAPPAEKQAEWSPSGTYNYGGAAYGQPYQQGYPQYQQQGGYQAGAQGWGQPQQAQAAASAGAAAEKKPYVPKSELGKAVGRLSVALPNAILGGLTGALTGGIQTVADTAGVQAPPPPAAVHPSDVAQSSQAAPAAAGQNDGWGEAAAAEPAAAAEDEWGRA